MAATAEEKKDPITPEEAIKKSQEQVEAARETIGDKWKKIDWKAEEEVRQFETDTRSWKERFMSFFRTPKLPEDSSLEAGVEKAKAAQEKLRKEAEAVLNNDGEKSKTSIEVEKEILEEMKKNNKEYAKFKAEYEAAMASGDQASLRSMERKVSKEFETLSVKVALEGQAESKLWKKALKTQELPPMTEAGAQLNEVMRWLVAVRGRLDGTIPAPAKVEQPANTPPAAESVQKTPEPKPAEAPAAEPASEQKPAAAEKKVDAVKPTTIESPKAVETRKQPTTLEEYRQLANELHHHLGELTDGREGWTGGMVGEVEETERALKAVLARIEELELSTETYPFPQVRLIALEERLAALEAKTPKAKLKEAHEKELLELKKAIVRRNMLAGLEKEVVALEEAMKQARDSGSRLGAVGKLEAQLKEIRERQAKAAAEKKLGAQIVEDEAEEEILSDAERAQMQKDTASAREALRLEKFQELYPFDAEAFQQTVDGLVARADSKVLERGMTSAENLISNTENKDATLTDDLRELGIRSDEEARAFQTYVVEINKQKLAVLQAGIQQVEALDKKSTPENTTSDQVVENKTAWDQNVDLYKMLISEKEGELEKAKAANDGTKVQELTKEIEEMKKNAAQDAATGEALRASLPNSQDNATTESQTETKDKPSREWLSTGTMNEIVAKMTQLGHTNTRIAQSSFLNILQQNGFAGVKATDTETRKNLHAKWKEAQDKHNKISGGQVKAA